MKIMNITVFVGKHRKSVERTDVKCKIICFIAVLGL
jgi:hypothetical protein